ncbi:MAG TPA: rubrerythrin family protein [Syntrophomonadaceae bacterium]|nr:rubrerythrin family protein [Syntrophomonadaceae bacterium]
MSTQDNLKEAFAGESQANRKYLAFSEKAKKEGFEKVSRLYQAVAEAETIHALKHFQVMNGVGSTLDNLNAAVAGEFHEFTEMYPGFIDEAKGEGNQGAQFSFQNANEAEKVHHGLFEKAQQAVEQGQDLSAEEFQLCPVCGWVGVEDPGRCPICGTPSSAFKKY